MLIDSFKNRYDGQNQNKFTSATRQFTAIEIPKQTSSPVMSPCYVYLGSNIHIKLGMQQTSSPVMSPCYVYLGSNKHEATPRSRAIQDNRCVVGASSV
ncbi:unnamed protein product [Calypogeia fissa]